MTEIDVVLAAVHDEVERAQRLHAPMHSSHEAYAVILEELDEAWDEVRADHPGAMADELVQTAAMCVRAIVDLGLTWKVKL